MAEVTPGVPPLADYRQPIEAALVYSGGTHTFDDIARMVAEGRLQYWPGARSVIITEIVTYPRQKVLNFFLAGGDLAELERMTPPILAWGRAQGCTRAALTGRKGWERTFLTREGWQPTLQVFEREL